MIKKLINRIALTLSCQSGRKISALAVAFASNAVLAGNVNWAHQTGTLSSNGAVMVKSLGGATYSSVQNPSGAIAKANQTATTQPPTVIIQATSAAYSESIALAVAGTSPPSCPATYNVVWQQIGNGCNTHYFNIGGSRFSYASVWSGSIGYMTYFLDNAPQHGGSASNSTLPNGVTSVNTLCYNGANFNWAATLCSK